MRRNNRGILSQFTHGISIALVFRLLFISLFIQFSSNIYQKTASEAALWELRLGQLIQV